MTGNAEFNTATMAKIYADQGLYHKAADIYRQLLAENPDRGDLSDALAAVEEKARGQRKKMTDLIPLLEEWVDLLIKYRRLRQLKGVRFEKKPTDSIL